MRSSLYKANVLASCAYAMASIFVCSTYQLWLPHPVGHLAPAASVLITAIWALHCWQLGVANGLNYVRAMRNASAPFSLAVLAGIACWIRYNQEYAKPYKAIEWLQSAAA